MRTLNENTHPPSSLTPHRTPALLTDTHHLPVLLPGLLELNVSGCPWSSVSALCQAVCPCLKLLDLSRVEELKDSHLRELLAPPPDTRIGSPAAYASYSLGAET